MCSNVFIGFIQADIVNNIVEGRTLYSGVGGSNNKSDANSHSVYKNYLKWFLIYVGVGFLISFLIPFTVSSAVYLLIFLALNALERILVYGNLA